MKPSHEVVLVLAILAVAGAVVLLASITDARLASLEESVYRLEHPVTKIPTTRARKTKAESDASA